MMDAIATRTDSKSAIIESVVINGDLAKLSPAERVNYYRSVCESLGLNPLTKPFSYIVLNGKLTLYTTKDATDQLRKKNGISINIISREKLDDLYVVTARATTPDGRQDESIGAVNIKGLSGDALANAIMKAETKGKRRVTLSICGLGWTDESEIESIPNAQPVIVDSDTGEIEGPSKTGSSTSLTESSSEASSKLHWSENTPTRKAFWLWTQEMSLTNTEVHSILGVQHLNEYQGTEQQARQQILNYVRQMAEDKRMEQRS